MINTLVGGRQTGSTEPGGSTAGLGRERQQLVSTATEQWSASLIDTGRRNTLLYYRDLRRGTLDLATAEAGALQRLLTGSTLRLSQLFPDQGEGATADAVARAGAIYKKIRELREERGITAGYLALGSATWIEAGVEDGRSAPAAPVLLREVSLRPRSGAADDFDVAVSDEPEVNPVLLHALSTGHGVDVDPDPILETAKGTGWESALDAFEQAAFAVPGVTTSPRTVIGTFSYAKLPMVNDLAAGGSLLAEHDVVAALAGDSHAQKSIRGEVHDIGDDLPDTTAPADEYLVADADSSQSHVLNAAVAGNNLVVKGPPGTGKSQTITNLVATLIARGQRVLFVAEKRAAIDAVLGRLQRAGLAEWAMDLHDGAANRRQVTRSLAVTLDRAARTPPVVVDELHRDLVVSRDRLLRHRRALHSVRQPWGISAFDAQERLLDLDGHNAPTARIPRAQLRRLDADRLRGLRESIARLADLGSFSQEGATSPWSGARLHSPGDAARALELVRSLLDERLPAVEEHLTAVVAECGLRTPASLDGWCALLALLGRTERVLSAVTPKVFDADLPALLASTGNRRYRREHQILGGWRVRRRLRREAADLWQSSPPTTAAMHALLAEATAVRDEWRAVCADRGSPRLPVDLAAAQASQAALDTERQALGEYFDESPTLAAMSCPALRDRLMDLLADEPRARRLPEIHRLTTELQAAGLTNVLDVCLQAHVGDDAASRALERAWLRGVLDEIGAVDEAYGLLERRTLDRAADAYRGADKEHIATTADRVRRRCAERLYEALDAHPEQATLVRKQAGLKRGHLTMRELIGQAPDVLLATKPCWAMSPLVVSQVLPLQRLFDVVVFDEASQVPPADAVPAIVRGTRVVVAGDERQLPPTAFFAAAEEDESTERIEGGSPTHVSLATGFESVLDALAAALVTRSLTWHYRSQDERLIAFSNAHIYDSSLTTFPGARLDGVVSHIHVPFDGSATPAEGSSSAEVTAVVQQIVRHAGERPDESLGVIAMGVKHAERIDAALRAALRQRPDLDDYFAENGPEPFFVKNLERVQGDERDAVILSVGYGKTADGRMLYRFGPLNNAGGERRLNVAVTRAKRRLAVVSSFTHHDLDPAKLTSEGAKLLGQFLAFAASGGHDLGSKATPPLALNPFEIDVRDRLVAAGIPLTPQYGVSGYRIDFAAAHPQAPGRMVLAIEADGASYHSSATARDRDRLRQEHLERLGWRFHRIWSTSWFRDRDGETKRVVEAYRAAVAAVDTADGAESRAGAHDRKQTIRGVRSSATSAATHGVGTETGDANDQVQVSGRSAGTARRPRPAVGWGLRIDEYSQGELVSLVRWIRSDGLLRTREELLRETMTELGFQKRGKRIAAALEEAIRLAGA